MPADRLTPQQLELLHHILRHPLGIQKDDLDGRTLRALETRELVEQQNGTVRATTRARSEYPVVAERDPSDPPRKLRDAQYQMLDQLIQSRVPIPDHQLDGRTAKSLIGRGLVKFSGGALVPTESGREMHSNHQLGTNGVPRKNRRGTDPRAQIILKAVGDLRRAIPSDSELAVGNMFCHVEDLLAGFQRVAARRQARRE